MRVQHGSQLTSHRYQPSEHRPLALSQLKPAGSDTERGNTTRRP